MKIRWLGYLKSRSGSNYCSHRVAVVHSCRVHGIYSYCSDRRNICCFESYTTLYKWIVLITVDYKDTSEILYLEAVSIKSPIVLDTT